MVPEVDDILSVLGDPPALASMERGLYVREKSEARSPGPNYLLREIRNASLGRSGERFVLNYERARLITAGRDRLANHVEHISVTRGDLAGFDVLSFDAGGRERLIEVRTTSFGRYTHFFVTANELRVSQEQSETYHLYRVHSFRKEPGLFTVAGRLDRTFDLSPTEFLARLA